MSQQEVLFKETIYPSLGVTISIIALDIAMAFALWAALGEVSALYFLVVAIMLSAAWWRSVIHRTTIDREFLHVNQARIEHRFLSSVEDLDAIKWRKRVGMDFDPRLFHAHKFWMKSGVEVLISDPRDPHPSWLIGSKAPLKLAEAINSRKSNS